MVLHGLLFLEIGEPVVGFTVVSVLESAQQVVLVPEELLVIAKLLPVLDSANYHVTHFISEPEGLKASKLRALFLV